MILSDYATTGDGLLAALQVLAVLVEDGRPSSEVMQVFEALPQRMRSVRFSGPSPLRSSAVQAAIAEAEGLLAGSGRLLIRASGTEPVIRVMAEGKDAAMVQNLVDRLCDHVAAAAAVAVAV